MGTYILIIFMATSGGSNAGTASVFQEFNSKKTCYTAGQSLVKNATIEKSNYLLTWGCFVK